MEAFKTSKGFLSCPRRRAVPMITAAKPICRYRQVLWTLLHVFRPSQPFQPTFAARQRATNSSISVASKSIASGLFVRLPRLPAVVGLWRSGNGSHAASLFTQHDGPKPSWNRYRCRFCSVVGRPAAVVSYRQCPPCPSVLLFRLPTASIRR